MDAIIHCVSWGHCFLPFSSLTAKCMWPNMDQSESTQDKDDGVIRSYSCLGSCCLLRDFVLSCIITTPTPASMVLLPVPPSTSFVFIVPWQPFYLEELVKKTQSFRGVTRDHRPALDLSSSQFISGVGAHFLLLKSPEKERKVSYDLREETGMAGQGFLTCFSGPPDFWTQTNQVGGQ